MDKQEKNSRKENLNPRKRNSILKEAVESDEVCNLKRRVSFADTTSIKEFLVLRDANTEWNCTYEEPVLYESSSSVNSTNISIQLNKEEGIQKKQEENSKIVSDSSIKIQDESFSNFLSGFLGINSESKILEKQIDEKICGANMKLTCQANDWFNKFESGNIENVSQNIEEDKTLLVPESLEITYLNKQPLDSLNQSTYGCSFQNLYPRCDNDFDENDDSEKINLEGKHIYSLASAITAPTPSQEVRDINECTAGLKAIDTDMELTSAVNFHCMENLNMKINDDIHRKMESHGDLNSCLPSHKENKNSLLQEIDLKNNYKISRFDDSLYSNSQEENHSKAFDQMKSIANAEMDMSITVNGDFLRKDDNDYGIGQEENHSNASDHMNSISEVNRMDMSLTVAGDFLRKEKDDLYSGQEENHSKAFDQMNSISEINRMDMSLTVAGDFLRKENYNVERETLKSEYEIVVTTEKPSHSINKMDPSNCHLKACKSNIISEFPLTLVANEKELGLTLSGNSSEIKKSGLPQLAEKNMENREPGKSEPCFGDSTINCITSFERSNKNNNESLLSEFDSTAKDPFISEAWLINESQHLDENSLSSLKLTLNGMGNQKNHDSLKNESFKFMSKQNYVAEPSLPDDVLNKTPSRNSEDKDNSKAKDPFISEAWLVNKSQHVDENSLSSLKLTLNGMGNQKYHDSLKNESFKFMSKQNHVAEPSLPDDDLNKTPSRNSEDKDKNLNINYSEEAKNLSLLKILEFSDQKNKQFSQVHDSNVKVSESSDRPLINVENSDLEIKTVTNAAEVNIIVKSKLEMQQSMLNSSEKGCDMQNALSASSSCKSSFIKITENSQSHKTDLSSSYLSKYETEANDRINSFSQGSFELLEDVVIDLMDNEPFENSHPVISNIDNKSEKDTSLSTKLMGKVHQEDKGQTLEIDMDCELDAEKKLVQEKQKENQYFYKTKNKARKRESDQSVGDSHFEEVTLRKASFLSSEKERKLIDCKLCEQHTFSRNSGMFNVENLRKDMLCINIEKLRMKIKINVSPHKEHLFIQDFNLETQMQNFLQNGFNFGSKAFNYSVQQLKNEIINTKLCQVESFIKKFLKSYWHILKLMRDIYAVKAYFPSFTDNDNFHILIVNARKHVLVNLAVKIGFHTSQNIVFPSFNVEANIKMGNFRKNIVDDAVKMATSVENSSLLSIIKTVHYRISNIM